MLEGKTSTEVPTCLARQRATARGAAAPAALCSVCRRKWGPGDRGSGGGDYGAGFGEGVAGGRDQEDAVAARTTTRLDPEAMQEAARRAFALERGGNDLVRAQEEMRQAAREACLLCGEEACDGTGSRDSQTQRWVTCTGWTRLVGRTNACFTCGEAFGGQHQARSCRADNLDAKLDPGICSIVCKACLLPRQEMSDSLEYAAAVNSAAGPRDASLGNALVPCDHSATKRRCHAALVAVFSDKLGLWARVRESCYEGHSLPEFQRFGDYWRWIAHQDARYGLPNSVLLWAALKKGLGWTGYGQVLGAGGLLCMLGSSSSSSSSLGRG